MRIIFIEKHTIRHPAYTQIGDILFVHDWGKSWGDPEGFRAHLEALAKYLSI